MKIQLITLLVEKGLPLLTKIFGNKDKKFDPVKTTLFLLLFWLLVWLSNFHSIDDLSALLTLASEAWDNI